LGRNTKGMPFVSFLIFTLAKSFLILLDINLIQKIFSPGLHDDNGLRH
jgi:hypothetical protein